MGCPVCAFNAKTVRYSITAAAGKNPASCFSVKQCEACGFAFVSPAPDSALLSSFYEGDYHKNKESFLQETLCRINRGLVVRTLKKIKPKGKVLDVGCGRGAFLQDMQKAGYQSFGIEPSQKGHTISSGSGQITVVNEPVETCRLPKADFDIVTLWHSLEHMPEPDNVLKKICELIKPDGILVIEVPNFSSWEARIFGENWCHLDVPRHLSFYSNKSMERLLQKHGFKIKSVSTESFFSSPLSGLKSALAALRASQGPAQVFAILRLPLALILSLARIIPLLNIRSCLRVYAEPNKEKR